MLVSFRSLHRYAIAAIALVLFSVNALGQPDIARVDPPNWWAGLPQSPMLMISGHDLRDAKVSTDYPGVKIVRSEAQAGGHYLFAWLELSRDVKPGTVVLKVASTSGSATTKFPLFARNGRSPAGVSQSDVIYLIMPDRFSDGNSANDTPPASPGQTDRANPRKWHGGDIKGITDHLAYLKQLGVTALWLTPWWKQAPSTSDYHGYHVVDFYAVDPHLGTINELQQLTAEAHRLGMKVIIDYVVNHTGPLHPWAQDPPTSTWFHGTPQKHEHFDYDFAQLIDPHASPRQYRPVLDGWFADSLPDLNPNDPRLEAYLRDNAIWWTELAALDGLRLDTFPYSSRRFWQQWHSDMRKAYPSLWTLAEISNPDPWITSYFAGGRKQNDGIDTGASTVFDFPLAYAIRDVTLRDGDARKIVSVLQHDSLYPNPYALVTMIGNHDMRRFMGEQGATVKKLEAAVSLLFTIRGVPEIYSGDEVAMPGGDDPDNRRDFPGGFPGDKRNAFTGVGMTAEEIAVSNFTRAMLRLRSQHPALTTGSLHHISVASDHYAFVRESGDDRLLVVFNSGTSPQKIPLSISGTALEKIHSLEPLLNASNAEIYQDNIIVPIDSMSVSVYVLH